MSFKLSPFANMKRKSDVDVLLLFVHGRSGLYGTLGEAALLFISCPLPSSSFSSFFFAPPRSSFPVIPSDKTFKTFPANSVTSSKRDLRCSRSLGFCSRCSSFCCCALCSSSSFAFARFESSGRVATAPTPAPAPTDEEETPPCSASTRVEDEQAPPMVSNDYPTGTLLATIRARRSASNCSSRTPGRAIFIFVDSFGRAQGARRSLGWGEEAGEIQAWQVSIRRRKRGEGREGEEEEIRRRKGGRKG